MSVGGQDIEILQELLCTLNLEDSSLKASSHTQSYLFLKIFILLPLSLSSFYCFQVFYGPGWEGSRLASALFFFFFLLRNFRCSLIPKLDARKMPCHMELRITFVCQHLMTFCFILNFFPLILCDTFSTFSGWTG